jgi:hypothetical protein
MDTHPQEEEEKEKEEEEEKEKEEFEYIPTERELLFNRWFEYKKQKRSKYTEIGKAQLFREWELKSDLELEIAINHSISNNYQGLFAPKASVEPKKEIGKFQQNLISLKNVHDQLTEEIQNGTFVNPYK